ncbi:MAG: MurR/RpiR family transcriptional regulator [Pseudomonadota bacterium]
MSSNQKNEICKQLLRDVDSLPPRLQLAAKYIIDHANDFGLDTIRVTADKIGISANSLVRLANHLGFASYEDLREPFRNSLVEQYDTAGGDGWIDRLSDSSEFGKSHAQTVRNEIDIVKQSLRLLTVEKTEMAVNMLKGARSAYVTATRASYALAYYFHYVGRMALPNLHLIPRHMGSPVDEMISVGKEDVLLAITFPPYSADTISALRLAKRNGTRVILISDSELIAPNIEADLFLKVSLNSLHHFSCFSGAMVVLECLLYHLVSRGGDEAQARIASYEALREDFGAYWQAKLPKLRKK